MGLPSVAQFEKIYPGLQNCEIQPLKTYILRIRVHSDQPMQRFTSITLLRALACAVLLAPAGPAVHAAELGDVAVRSFIGQPLAADIELVALAPDELNALQVKLAQADVFRGANITMNPALSSVRMAVVKRDQKQFLHVTTTRPITAEYVHLYLELSAAGRHDVRLATVWLQVDPNPPAPPAPLAAAAGGANAANAAGGANVANAASAASAASASVAGSAGAAGAADAAQLAAQARAERASSVAVAAAAARDRSRPAPLPSVHESEFGVPGAIRAAAAAKPSTATVAVPASARPGAPVAVRELPSRIADAMGTPRITRAPASAADVPEAKSDANPEAKLEAKPASKSEAKLDAKSDPKLEARPAKVSPPTVAAASSALPAKPATKREPAAADGDVPVPVSQALLKLPALPLPAGVKRPAAPAACAPSGMSAKECKALDTQSIALSSKLAELEAKMKALQGAINGSAPAAQKTGQAARAVAAGTAALAAAGSSVAAAVASPAMAATNSAHDAHDAQKQNTPKHDAPKPASVASAAPGPASGPALASAKASAKAVAPKSDDGHGVANGDQAHAAAKDAPSASSTASAALASASASAGEQGTSATASASAAAAPAKPLKRVLPKLKYKKEKPVDQPTNYVAWGAGALGVLLAAGAGLIYWRRKKSGAAPLKIWQGFRQKKPAAPVATAPEAPPQHEVKPESITQ